MLAPMAQVMAGSLVYYVIVTIIVCAVIGIGMVVVRQMGVTIPPFIITIAWIILAAVIGILAIKFLISLT